MPTDRATSKKTNFAKMAADELVDQSPEETDWKPANLGDVLEVLGCCEGDPMIDVKEQMPQELMDLDSIDIENTLEAVEVNQMGEHMASLEMFDGTLLICPLCVVKRSAYLLDMSKVENTQSTNYCSIGLKPPLF